MIEHFVKDRKLAGFIRRRGQARHLTEKKDTESPGEVPGMSVSRVERRRPVAAEPRGKKEWKDYLYVIYNIILRMARKNF